jgi:hypothetical protein
VTAIVLERAKQLAEAISRCNEPGGRQRLTENLLRYVQGDETADAFRATAPAPGTAPEPKTRNGHRRPCPALEGKPACLCGWDDGLAEKRAHDEARPASPPSPRYGMTADDVARREQLARPDLTVEEITGASPPSPPVACKAVGCGEASTEDGWCASHAAYWREPTAPPACAECEGTGISYEDHGVDFIPPEPLSCQPCKGTGRAASPPVCEPVPCKTCGGSRVAPRWKLGFTRDPHNVTTCLDCKPRHPASKP